MAARTAMAEAAARMTVNVAAKAVVSAAATDAMPFLIMAAGAVVNTARARAARAARARARAARARAAGAWLKAASRRA